MVYRRRGLIGVFAQGDANTPILVGAASPAQHRRALERAVQVGGRVIALHHVEIAAMEADGRHTYNFSVYCAEHMHDVRTDAEPPAEGFFSSDLVARVTDITLGIVIIGVAFRPGARCFFYTEREDDAAAIALMF